MATSDEFKEQRSSRKRKREINEENINMDTEQDVSPSFPPINPSQLNVKIYSNYKQIIESFT